MDKDNDGAFSDIDCDDNEPLAFPGNAEILNDGIDNDCDGDIDEDTEDTTVTDQDGNNYDYLIYGDQVWTVENAEMVTYRDGTPIPEVTANAEWSSLTTGAWCYYNNDSTKPKLYNWYAVMGIHDTDPNTPNKELAPEGWHVPSDAEWTTLEEHLIANDYNFDPSDETGNFIGKAMASTTGWNIPSSSAYGLIGLDQDLNNDSGFNAFPVGYRYNNGAGNEGSSGIFWTSTEDNTDTDYAWFRNLFYNDNFLSKGTYFRKSYGCLLYTSPSPRDRG